MFMSPGRNVLLGFTKTMGVPVCTKFYKVHWNLDDTEPYLQLKKGCQAECVENNFNDGAFLTKLLS